MSWEVRNLSRGFPWSSQGSSNDIKTRRSTATALPNYVCRDVCWNDLSISGAHYPEVLLNLVFARPLLHKCRWKGRCHFRGLPQDWKGLSRFRGPLHTKPPHPIYTGNHTHNHGRDQEGWKGDGYTTNKHYIKHIGNGVATLHWPPQPSPSGLVIGT